MGACQPAPRTQVLDLDFLPWRISESELDTMRSFSVPWRSGVSVGVDLDVLDNNRGEQLAGLL